MSSLSIVTAKVRPKMITTRTVPPVGHARFVDLIKCYNCVPPPKKIDRTIYIATPTKQVCIATVLFF